MALEDWFIFNFDTAGSLLVWWTILVIGSVFGAIGLYSYLKFGVGEKTIDDKRNRLLIVISIIGIFIFNFVFGFVQYLSDLDVFPGTEWDEYTCILASLLLIVMFMSLIYIKSDENSKARNFFFFSPPVMFALGLSIVLSMQNEGVIAIFLTPMLIGGSILLVALLSLFNTEREAKSVFTENENLVIKEITTLVLVFVIFVGFGIVANEGHEPLSSIFGGGIAVLPVIFSIAFVKSKKKRASLKVYCFNGHMGETKCKPFKAEYCKDKPNSNICKE